MFLIILQVKKWLSILASCWMSHDMMLTVMTALSIIWRCTSDKGAKTSATAKTSVVPHHLHIWWEIQNLCWRDFPHCWLWSRCHLTNLMHYEGKLWGIMWETWYSVFEHGAFILFCLIWMGCSCWFISWAKLFLRFHYSNPCAYTCSCVYGGHNKAVITVDIMSCDIRQYARNLWWGYGAKLPPRYNAVQCVSAGVEWTCGHS